jgi:hypothetical protein
MFYLDGNQLAEACSKGDEMCRCTEGFDTCWKRAAFMMIDFSHCAFGASAAFGGKTVEEAMRAPKGVLPSPELLWGDEQAYPAYCGKGLLVGGFPADEPWVASALKNMKLFAAWGSRRRGRRGFQPLATGTPAPRRAHLQFVTHLQFACKSTHYVVWWPHALLQPPH